MDLPLIVGTDGSDCSLEAVDWAADEAARHRLPLRILHASLWERYEGVTPSFASRRPSEEVMAEHIAASAAERAAKRHPELQLTAEVLGRDPLEALVDESDHAFAIVVGQRGRGDLAALLLGSVSLATAARARCPVFVVRGGQRQRRSGFGWLTLAVGEDGPTRAAVEFAFREAAARGCGVEAVHAWRWPGVATGLQPAAGTGEDTAKRRLLHAEQVLDETLREPMAAYPDVQVRRSAVEGTPRGVLLEASTAADLLVVGAGHRHGVFGWQLGPVSHAVLHHAECPVAVVPQH